MKNESTASEKMSLRRAMRQARASLDTRARHSASQAICDCLQQLLLPGEGFGSLSPASPRAGNERGQNEGEDNTTRTRIALAPGDAVAVYLAKEDEACVDAFARQLLARGVRVAAPVVPAVKDDSQSGELLFFALRDLETVRQGAFGVREPMVEGDALPLRDIAVLVVPGLAFGRDGNRLGQGGGFFDRILMRARESGTLLIGVCFSCQVCETVPSEAHDQKVTLVVTETEVTQCCQPSRA